MASNKTIIKPRDLNNLQLEGESNTYKKLQKKT
jgi:hypothetical protein